MIPVHSPQSNCLFSVSVDLGSGYGRLGMEPDDIGNVDVFVDFAFNSEEEELGFMSSSTQTDDILFTISKGDGLFGGVVKAPRQNSSSDVFELSIKANFVAMDIGISVLLVTYDNSNSTDASRMIQFLGSPPNVYPSSLNLILPDREGGTVSVLRPHGYSPLKIYSNLLRSEECSDIPLIDNSTQLNVTFQSPYQAVLEWNLLNRRMGLDFRSLTNVSIMECNISQTGFANPTNECSVTIETGTTGFTNHTTATQPFREYTFQVHGPSTQSQRLTTRSPEDGEYKLK